MSGNTRRALLQVTDHLNLDGVPINDAHLLAVLSQAVQHPHRRHIQRQVREQHPKALHEAARRGVSNREVRRLVSTGYNPRARHGNAFLTTTPLYQATRSGQPATVRALVKAGANVKRNDVDLNGRTALHIVAGIPRNSRNSASMVRNILDAGAAPHRPDTILGAYPIHYAAGSGQVGAIRHLVSEGAKVNSRDSAGKTPLHWASEENQHATARLLMRLGAHSNARTKNGRTAFDLAPRDSRVAKSLADAGTISGIKRRK